MVFKKLLAARFGLISVVLHAALGLAIWRLRPASPPSPEVSIELVQQPRRALEPEPQPPTPPPTAPRPDPVRSPPRPVIPPRAAPPPRPVPSRPPESAPPPSPQNPPSSPSATPPPSEAPPPAGTPAPSTAPPPPGKVNLFSPEALGTVVGSGPPGSAKPSWLGRTRRAGEGGGEDPSIQREEAAQRVRSIVADLTGRERAQSGNVAPVWRDAERRLDQQFHPPAALVTDDNAAKAWAKAWLKSKPSGGSTPRGLDPSREVGNQRYDQLLAGANSTASGATWYQTEIEVVVDESGQLVSARVVRGSGRRKLDESALEAVRKAMEQQPVKDPKGRTVALWGVGAAVAVSGPTNFGFTFDETLRKIKGNYAFKKDVQTRIRLLSVRPALD